MAVPPDYDWSKAPRTRLPDQTREEALRQAQIIGPHRKPLRIRTRRPKRPRIDDGREERRLDKEWWE